MTRRGVIGALVALLVAFGACSEDDAGRGGDGAIDEAGPISVFDLRVGDCLAPDEDTAGEVENIQAVPCEEPHTQEVFAIPEMEDEGGVYPGEAAIRQFADASCLEAFREYTGTDYLDSNLFFSYLHPSLDSWNEGDDRTVVCVIVSTGEETTGSVRRTTTTTEADDEDDKDGRRTTTTEDEDEDEDEG